ncbi:hypothetical protein ABL78_2722 [Leptomonas seymouri]|uniref:Uncharacterized protein n=1 Tax=Leptomonas seymouri TaxID=5684 RepID=A0A0N1I0J3_LEPSE|nr:hypothetical protein ABL78_2722 [Leptomonas seymouri]|eukprot:KPI88218.1 hypothetical protein ABL78_2722 [Leptomonas seymouri]
MSNVFDAAQRVLEVLRVDLHEWKRSPDLRDKVQRIAARKEHQMSQESSAACSPPAFRFCPLVTAPTTCVVFSDSRHSRDSRGAVTHPKSAESSVAREVKAEKRVSVPRASPPSLIPATHGQHGTLAKVPRGVETEEKIPAPSPGTSGALWKAEPSRWETKLRQLSPATQHLFADMMKRGQVAMAAEGQASSIWRRHVEGPRDAELRRAVRDYLYRMNVLSCMWVAMEDGGSGGALEVPPVFADAIMNGAALCQLVSTLLLDGDGKPRRDAVPCRCPRTLGEIRVNYAQALSTLRGAPPAAQERIPPSAWTILPEEVLLNAAPTALLELFVHLISAYLPSPEELPAWKRQMCWQPPADRAACSSIPPSQLAAAEDECCTFLHAYGVLPDAAVYNLPGPECLLPSPTAAPFMASWKAYVARADAPPCLLLPSIWPYLCNGVLLVLLARRSGIEAAAAAVRPAPCGAFVSNPRTASRCMANISSAFRSFRAVSTLTSSLEFFSAESATAVLRGDRLHIVKVLLHLRAVLEGKKSRTLSSLLLLLPQRTEPMKKSPATARDENSLHQTPVTSALEASPSFQRTPATANARSFSTASSSASLSIRRRDPATIVKHVARRYNPASDTAATTPLQPPLAFFDPALGCASQRNNAPSSQQKDMGRTLRSEDSGVAQWLCSLVGPDFRYTALDKSFSFDARHFTVSQPCLIFSEGVLLAHVIGLLECLRCDQLDCVRPATKRAAKLFNVRRCLEFLRSCAGVDWELPLLDEALVSGSAEGVRSLLRALRDHYGLARKGKSLRSEERALATTSTM